MTGEHLRAPGAAGPPTISVVIGAWDRREYLLDAARSARSQEGAPPDVELLVVKNFEDPAIDAALHLLGARLVLDTTPGVGAGVARALAEARGEVVCFLDDDDEFAPGKVASVARQFAADPDLVLWRHGWRPIDARGRAIDGWPIHDWPASPPAGPIELRTAADKRRSRVLPMYNLSTISVRRRSLLAWAPMFREVPAASDSLVFLAALASPGHLRLDPAPLTRHRVHPSASRESLGSAGVRPPSSPAYLERSLRALAAQEAMVRGTPAERWAHWIYLITRIDAYLGLAEAAPPSAREYWEFLVGALRERQRFRLPPLAFALARRLFPRWSFDHWWALRRWMHKIDAREVDMGELFSTAEEPR